MTTPTQLNPDDLDWIHYEQTITDIESENQTQIGVFGESAHTLTKRVARTLLEKQSATGDPSLRRAHDHTAVQQEVPLLIELSQSSAQWADLLDFHLNWKSSGRKGGSEHVVYADHGYYFKANFKTQDRTWNDYLDRTRIYNNLFPELAYEVLGMTRVRERNDYPAFISKQIEVVGQSGECIAEIQALAAKAAAQNLGEDLDTAYYQTRREHENQFREKVAVAMKEKGGTPSTTLDAYVFDGFTVSDARPANVLLGEDDELYFIDVNIGPNTGSEVHLYKQKQLAFDKLMS
ncbi:MAG: hypothetical protein QM496_17480 [Verrucomicrobiota bacterium]